MLNPLPFLFLPPHAHRSGIEALDQSALWTKGELRVVSAADPEKLRRRLHKATGKNVDLAIPKPQQAVDKKQAAADKETAAAMEELLRRSLQQQQVLPGAAVWGALQQPGGYGYGAAAAYPWGMQVPQPEAYPSSYHYPAAGAWGAYAYPSVAAQGAYGGGGWLGHGAY